MAMIGSTTCFRKIIRNPAFGLDFFILYLFKNNKIFISYVFKRERKFLYYTCLNENVSHSTSPTGRCTQGTPGVGLRPLYPTPYLSSD